MAKYTKVYPTGAKRLKYVTKNFLPTVKRTKGRVQHLPGARYFLKPSLGKVLIRKSGVIRRSADVEKINNQLKALKDKENHPCVECAGKPWDEFIKCVSDKMKKVIKPVAEDLGERRHGQVGLPFPM